MEWTIRLEAKTGWGEVETVELVSITRPVLAATADDVGLSLAEAKSLLASLQEAMVRGQVAEYLHCRRVCPDCLTFQPVKDRRQRRVQSLFGATVVMSRPMTADIVICRCRRPPCVDEGDFSRAGQRIATLRPRVAHPNSGAYRRRWERACRSARAPGSWRSCCLHHQPAMSASAIGSTPSLGNSRRPTPSE